MNTRKQQQIVDFILKFVGFCRLNNQGQSQNIDTHAGHFQIIFETELKQASDVSHFKPNQKSSKFK